MKKFDISFILFRATCFAILFAGIFAFGFISGNQQVLLYHPIAKIIDNIVVVKNEIPVLLKTKPTHFLQPARYPGAGVTVNSLDEKGDYVALASFFDDSNEIRLIRRDGSIVARWPVVLSDLVQDLDYLVHAPQTDWNVDIHGLEINPDGSVVFNFENTALIKLDHCGNLVWNLRHPTHHSVERAADGGYWVPGRRWITADAEIDPPLIEPPYYDDLILKVSESGEIEHGIPVSRVLENSRLKSMLLTNAGEAEIVHLNDIEELPASLASDFPDFSAGDLMLSLRNHHMILVIDPVTERVKWWQVGPWLRQHDPDFQPGGSITVFDNRRTYRTTDHTVLGGSAIVAHDPVSRRTETLWGDAPEQSMYTPIRGAHQMRPGGGVLAVEQAAGRVFETDAAGGVVWEFINRYDEENVVEINSALALPPDYFQDVDWSCNPAHGELEK